MRSVELRRGAQHAALATVGGGIRTYTLGGRDVLAGYPAGAACQAARGQLLAPWPNRLRGGTYTWEGERHTVPLDEPELGNALHGLVRSRHWEVREQADATATLAVRLEREPGYPFTLDLAATYTLTEHGLEVTVTARNGGSRTCPFALGAHPYLALPGPVDDAVLHVPADTYLPTDRALIPTGRASVSGAPYDFRRPRPIGPTALDHTFTGLARDADGRAEVAVTAPDGVRTVLWADAAHPYVHVYTGDAPEAGARRGGLAVEPATAPPNAFATGDDVLRLKPGAAVEACWGVRCEGPRGPRDGPGTRPPARRRAGR